MAQFYQLLTWICLLSKLEYELNIHSHEINMNV